MRFQNWYKCANCKTEWADLWDSICDDDCGNCGTIMTPYDSDDLEEGIGDECD